MKLAYNWLNAQLPREMVSQRRRKPADRKPFMLNRACPKYLTSWQAGTVVAVSLYIVFTFLQSHLSLYSTEVYPLNQLERGFVSREAALEQLKDFIIQIQQHGQNSFDTNSDKSSSRFGKQITKDIGVLQGMGLHVLTNELVRLSGKDIPAEEFEVEEEEISIGNTNESFNPHFVIRRFCYESSITPQGYRRQIEASFCPRLMSLLSDIQKGSQPPLLTVFTWLPEPVSVADRYTRRILFQNWNEFRPLVQPVLFTESRANMAYTNILDWPCLPVTIFNKEGIPIFKNLAKEAARLFNSSFYGFAQATTIFDASLLETLMKLKEMYIDKFKKQLSKTHFDLVNNFQAGSSVRPVLVYGRALKIDRVGKVKELSEISSQLNVSLGHEWENRKDSLVYFFYFCVDFSDVPDFVIDDRYLTSLLVSRSMALGHLVVDASGTIFSVHILPNETDKDWNGYRVPVKSRDLLVNKRLGAQYFHSIGKKKPEKWLNEVGTKFSKNGNIFIDIRSEESIGQK